MIDGKIKKTLDISFNLDYLVILPRRNEELFDAFNYTFDNTILFNNTVEDVEFLIEFLKRNVVAQLIFVDYYGEYSDIINALIDEHEIKFIFTSGLGELSDPNVLNEFNQICEKYDCGIIDEIGFLDYGLYKSVHGRRRNTRYLMLDLAKNEMGVFAAKDKTVGILNCADSDYDSFYNELGSFVFLPEYRAKMTSQMKTVMDFTHNYNVETMIVEKREDLFCNNVCNLDINFAGSKPLIFIKSMDYGVPCILGNNGFLSSEYSLMNKLLVMESDDNVEEIAEKIRGATVNKNNILKEYKRFRADYSKRARRLVDEFLGLKRVERDELVCEKLLTVVVPVYNTEKYLARCLDSIIDAGVSGMEVLIINDGSTDGSKNIAENYLEKYSDLIRYIEQKNQGLGNVRNVGIREAKGKYLASVDSDDTIQPELFKEALPYMRADVDVIICDWMSVTEKGSFETVARDWVFEKKKEVEGLLYTTIMPSTCNKIIKRSLFVDDKVEYLEEKYEDLSANPRVLLKANTIKYIRKPYYNYYLRDNSLMRSKINPKEMVDALHFLDTNLKIRKGMLNEEEFKYYTYSWRIEEYVINPLYEMKGKELRTVIDYIDKKIGKLMKDIFKSKYYKKMLQGLKSKELRDFIEKRNKSFEEKKFAQFVKETKKPCVITASIIYYGD